MQDPQIDRIARVRAALNARFAPSHLDVTDESFKHAGHAEAGKHTHIAITIRSAAFAGLGRIDMHRKINAALVAEFADGLHAVRIDAAQTP